MPFDAFNKVTALLEQCYVNALKLIILEKAYFKVVVASVKIGEAIVFFVDPYY